MAISSPCVKLCVLDDRFGLCLGCGRTLAEIGAWGGMDEDARLAVMAGLPERLAALGSRKGRRAALAKGVAAAAGG